MSRMRRGMVSAMGWVYHRARASRRLSGLYYSVVNTRYFTNLQVQEWMLADRERLRVYREAIERHVHEGDRVVDLGTGTGILAFFAFRMRPSSVVAIEHGPIIDLARQAAAENHFDAITFIQRSSKEVVLDEKVDIVIHEQMGAWCFDERMIDNLLDLRERVLKPGGRILPGVFRWYIEPVQLQDIHRVPFAWEQPIEGISFSALREQNRGAPNQYASRMLRSQMVDRLLGVPEAAWVTDLHTLQRHEVPTAITVRRTVTSDGRLDGFCVFFEAEFDEDLVLSTRPPDSTLHWNVPLIRAIATDVRVGDVLELTMTIGEIGDPTTYRWDWSLQPAAGDSGREPPLP